MTDVERDRCFLYNPNYFTRCGAMIHDSLISEPISFRATVLQQHNVSGLRRLQRP
jgi:hypothetical protein